MGIRTAPVSMRGDSYLPGDPMAIKLIAIDMDGTLLLPDHTISPAVKAAIAAARASAVLTLVLTTGRAAGVHSYLKSCIWSSRVIAITYNGALVQRLVTEAPSRKPR